METRNRAVLVNGVGFVTIPGWFLAFDAWLRPTVWVWHVWLAVTAIAVCLLLHETLHYAAIRLTAPTVHVRYVRQGINPGVRIEGTLSARARVIFLLTPFAFISCLAWAVAALFPVAAVTCVIVAATNAACSTADLWRCGEVVLESFRRRGPVYEGSAESSTAASSPTESSGS